MKQVARVPRRSGELRENTFGANSQSPTMSPEPEGVEGVGVQHGESDKSRRVYRALPAGRVTIVRGQQQDGVANLS